MCFVQKSIIGHRIKFEEGLFGINKNSEEIE